MVCSRTSPPLACLSRLVQASVTTMATCSASAFVDPDFVRHLARSPARLGCLAASSTTMRRLVHSYFHLRMETLVPSPGFDQISNSLESRLAPPRPSPMPFPEV